MDIESLRGFVVLAVSKSFSKASRELYISQSALSRRISSLEASVGDKLFVRANPLSLTSTGEFLFADAQRTIQAYDEFQKKMNEIKKRPSSELVIQDTSYCRFTLGLLAVYNQIFAKLYPRILIKHNNCPSGMNAFTAVSEGFLDVSFFLSFCGADDAEYMPVIPTGLEVVEVIEGRRYLSITVSKENTLLNAKPGKLEDIKTVKFIGSTVYSFEVFKESFMVLCQQQANFTPIFDYRIVPNGRYFFSEHLGESAFISGRPIYVKKPDSIIPSNLMEELEEIVFNQYHVRLYAVYSTAKAGEALLSYIDEITRFQVPK